MVDLIGRTFLRGKEITVNWELHDAHESLKKELQLCEQQKQRRIVKRIRLVP